MDNNNEVINANSFRFRQQPNLRDKPIRHRVKRIKKRNLTLTDDQQQQQQQQTERESLPLEKSTVLEGFTIYVDKSVDNRDRLINIAHALAATIAENWNLSVTHVIHGFNKHTTESKRHLTPRIITKSLGKKMRVVSPTWLIACYDERKKLSETFYPYEMESNDRIAPLRLMDQRTYTNTNTNDDHNRDSNDRHDNNNNTSLMVDDDNPFDLEPDEFAEVDNNTNQTDDDDEDHRDNNRKLTEFFKRNKNNDHQSEPSSNDSNSNKNIDQSNNSNNNNTNNDNNNSNNKDVGSVNNNGGDDYNECYFGDDDSRNDNHTNDNISIHLPSMGDEDTQDDQQSNSLLIFDTASIDDTTPIAKPKPETIADISDSASNRSWTPDAMLEMLNTMNNSRRKKIKSEKNKHIIGKDIDDSGSNNKDNNDGGDGGDDSNISGGNDSFVPALPDLDPRIKPKRTLGQEERIKIWYGEHSLHNDIETANVTTTPIQISPSPKRSNSMKKKKLTTTKFF